MPSHRQRWIQRRQQKSSNQHTPTSPPQPNPKPKKYNIPSQLFDIFNHIKQSKPNTTSSTSKSQRPSFTPKTILNPGVGSNDCFMTFEIGPGSGSWMEPSQLFSMLSGNSRPPSRKKKSSTTTSNHTQLTAYFNDPQPLLPVHKPIRSLRDLIDVAKHWINLEETTGTIPHTILYYPYLKELVPIFEEMDSMIHMQNIKQWMMETAIYYLQHLDNGNQHMLHTLLTGPPGTGKSAVIQILAKFYSRLGFLNSDEVVYVSRSDLVAKYVGHTASKTRDTFEQARGKVIVIDEVYSLGAPDSSDSFSKEAIDTINQCLTEFKDDLICIIAGYKDAVEECFLKQNRGLDRRFTIRLEIDPYNASHLTQILHRMIQQAGWALQQPIPTHFFETHFHHFPNFGGDVESLFLMTKIAHALRIMRDNQSQRRFLTIQDLQHGYQLYIDKRGVRSTSHLQGLYN